ncbi:hypothetical protein A1O1_07163 [Capronia coronata CBS 617.96]|uniref:Uncharacterized protein n=1 Tax=Capronia coronata CBS 617.96 TaxID=1182541 RepID=W9Y1N0_9EURO|nr:uncharacterized protein A1O1_07163 [Capronia coronata CBS 617.96]EXJ83540.1 hypothetical protein A1O1_07163 [Capronia coronata CBS 617.96]
MRLRLLIQRHSLPSVQIVYTTGTGPASRTKSRDSTIADLLHDVNDLVPLESADGEWGLEDYVVEVVPAFDKSAAYECLHFQTCEAVLREDDEVVIRALSSEELRIRRLGGRHQISGDGKHLIDGVAFGKQWLRKARRPGIVIPPRKRRRMLAAQHDDEDDEDEERVRQILAADEGYYPGAMVPAAANDEEENEDDEDDEDYVDNPLQIAVRADFDDADSESAEDPGLSDTDLQDEDLSDEVKLLLKEAAEIQKAASGAVARDLVGNHLKRKREVDDEGEDHESITFEGFSTPVKAAKHVPVNEDEAESESEDDSGTDGDGDSMMREITDHVAEKRAKNIIAEDEDDEDEVDEDVQDMSDSDDSSSSESSAADSATDSMVEELAMQEAKKRALNLIEASDTSSDSSEYAESSSEDKADIDVEEISSSGSDSDSGWDSESDSDDESDSESETSSSSSESESEADSEVDKGKKGLKTPSTANPGTSGLQPPTFSSENTPKPATVPPGSGTGRTHTNNSRARKRRRLNFLKEQGLLPKEADFRALAAYDEAQQNSGTEQAGFAEQEQAAAGGQQPEILSDDQEKVTAVAVNVVTRPESKAEAPGDLTADKEAVAASSAGEPKISQPEIQAETEPAPKRARLDLASSRRMLFSSLGLRTPKTPEAEQALREKLSKSIRPLREPSAASAESALPLPETETVAEFDDSWKDKLVIAAVECEEQGGVLTPPPFPFQQRWTKTSTENVTKSKRRARDQAQYYEDNQAPPQEDQEDAFAPDVSMLASADGQQSKVVDGTNSAEENLEGSDDIPLPTNFDILPDLDQASVVPGVVIAYRELHVDASTNYQPEISSFRVGRVSEMGDDGSVYLTLAKSCLEPSSKMKYDEETGERVYGKFEIPSEDAESEPDDGTREVSFSSMISPKLVQPSSVEVPGSNHSSGLRGGDASDSYPDQQYAAIPETVQQEVVSSKPGDSQIPFVEIATPRRNEISDIIKEAGFNSALDEELLQPDPISSDQHETDGDSPDLQNRSQEEYPHRFRKESPRLNDSQSYNVASSEMEDSAYVQADHASVGSAPEQPSSPFVHTAETVEYPHISQIEINSSGPPLTINSSSHQDAQKNSPTPAVELSFTALDRNDSGDEADHETTELADHAEYEDSNQRRASSEPLGSDVPQSQSQAASFESFEEEAEQHDLDRGDSFLDHGYAGHDSSYHDDDGCSEDDSDDLPSLLDITSGRSHAKGTKLRSSKVPPPPTRRSARTSKKTQSSTPPSSPDPPPSSQPEIKLSQSQYATRLSQVPAGSQVIDLTFSSSPPGDDEDSDIYRKKGSSQANGNKTTTSREAKQENGLGKRRLLTTKKRRSYY